VPLFLFVLSLTPPASAQGAAFRTPGMPGFGRGADATQLEATQSSRFSSVFNPALFFTVDAHGDWQNVGGNSPDDGARLELRSLELGAHAWVDPNAWAYFNASTEGEELAVEEAALHYVGFDSSSTLRAGRFFVDFGKQMQSHVHHLRTTERPLVLRAYLGEEVKGDGLQWDHWVPIGEGTVLRWSVGAFQSLLPEEDELFPDDTRSVADRKGFGDLNYTARVTAFADVSERATLQVGASARLIPDYSIEFAAFGDVERGLSSRVYGVDVTYGHVDDTAQKGWTTGLEYLVNAGDNGGENTMAGAVTIFDRALHGFYVFADYAWDVFNSAGVQYSGIQVPDARQTRSAEIELYFTHRLSEYQRLRLSLMGTEMEAGRDSVRAVLQYTAALGAHGHGINW
jgi:hypothetical protein